MRAAAAALRLLQLGGSRFSRRHLFQRLPGAAD
jgi:non-ribosomal peptide synthetase component E (peptide arylation enzyme)